MCPAETAQPTWPSPRPPASLLAGYNNLAGARPWHRRWYPAVNALAAAVLLAAATASGLTADDLGLRRDRLRAGLRLGSAAAAPVVAAFGLAALNPATRPLLNDQRIAGLDRRELAYQVLLRIPVGTVAWEEIAFRGSAPRRAAPGDGRARGHRRGQRGVRPVAYSPDGRGAGGQRARGRSRRPDYRGHWRSGRDGGGGDGVFATAGTFWEPGRAGVAAPGRQLRGPAGQRPDPIDGLDAIQDRLAQPWPDLAALVSGVCTCLEPWDGVWTGG